MSLSLYKNAASLLLAGLVEKLSFVFFIALLARKFSRAEFGIYSITLNMLLLGGVLASLGIDYVVIREVARNPRQSGVIFNNSVLLALLLSALAWPLITILSRSLSYDPEIVSLLRIAGICLIFMGLSQVAAAVVKAHERMDLFALISSCFSILLTGLGLLVVFLGGKVFTLLMLMVFLEGAKALVLVLVVHRHFCPVTFQPNRTTCAFLAKQALPFALMMAYGVFLRRSDMMLIGWLCPLEDAADYGAVTKVADFLSLLSGSVIGALFPTLSGRLVVAKEDAWTLYDDSLQLMSILGFGAAFSLAVLSEPVVLTIFGERYLKGTTALVWLGWAFLISVLSGPAGVLLLAAGDRMYRLFAMCITLLAANIALNMWLIPIYGITGAAIATFISTTLGFFGRVLLSMYYFKRLPDFLHAIWRPLLASAVMALILSIVGSLNLSMKIILGAGTYLFGLALLGEFRKPVYTPIVKKCKHLLYLDESTSQ